MKNNNEPILCGFVWCDGYRDFEAWEVSLSKEDRDAIEQILVKYDTKGSSLRNCWDSKFNDVFFDDYR